PTPSSAKRCTSRSRSPPRSAMARSSCPRWSRRKSNLPARASFRAEPPSRRFTMSMACLIHGALDLRLEQETPAPLGPDDVLLRLGAGGICGSDLHYYQHGRVGAFVVREPLVPGHEASGIVDAVGAEVTRVTPGQKVAINPSHPCGRCDYCHEGRGNLCRNMFFLGSASVFPHAQGMFRERFVMGERQLTPVTESEISLGEIACAEPLSIGLHAIQRAGPVLGETVLVTGV